MRKNAILGFMLYLFSLLLPGNSAFTQEVSHLYTNNYAPLCYQQGGKDRGVVYETVKELTRRCGLKPQVSFDIWQNSYKKALQNKDSGVFPTAMTDERADLFNWVGPLCSLKYYVYASTTKQKIISTIDDIKNVGSIATFHGYAFNPLLKAHGCNNLRYYKTPKEAIISVILGKSDICIFPEFIINTFHKNSGYTVKSTLNSKGEQSALDKLFSQEGGGVNVYYGTSIDSYEDVKDKHRELGHNNRRTIFDTPDIKEVLLFRTEELYLALNKSIPAATVKTLQSTLHKMQTDGTIHKIYSRNLVSPDIIPDIPESLQSKGENGFAAVEKKENSNITVSFDELPPLRVYAENFPPFTFNVDNSNYIQGAAADLVHAIEKLLGQPASQITLTDWNTAFDIVKTTPNTAICTLKRIPEREDSFYWIGPYAADSAWLYTRRDYPGNIADIAEAKKISGISCIDQAFAHAFLMNNDFTNITPFAKPDDAVMFMMDDPEHAAALSSASAPYIIRNAGFSPINARAALQLSKKTNYYIGISKSTPKETALRWMKAFDSIKSSGKLNDIIQRWIK